MCVMHHSQGSGDLPSIENHVEVRSDIPISSCLLEPLSKLSDLSDTVTWVRAIDSRAQAKTVWRSDGACCAERTMMLNCV